MTAGTIRAVTPSRIGVPGNGDSTPAFVGALVAGHLTVAGKTVLLTKQFLPLVCGHLTLSGKLQRVNSSGWQYITIASLASIHVVATLYDGLDPLAELTPAVGDIWRVPLFSQDGGSIIVAVDGRFQIGAPTQGFDVIQGVMYYSILTGLWYGPADFTVLNPPLNLLAQIGHITLQGKSVVPTKQKFFSSGRLILFGHAANVRRNLPVLPAHLSTAGKATAINRTKAFTAGHITVTGKTVAKTETLTLQFGAGHVTLSGKSELLSKGLLIITVGHQTLTGRSVNLATGQPLPIGVAGHLVVAGRFVRLLKGAHIEAGHLRVHGKAVVLKSTGAIHDIDKPGIKPRRTRRNIVSSSQEV